VHIKRDEVAVANTLLGSFKSEEWLARNATFKRLRGGAVSAGLGGVILLGSNRSSESHSAQRRG
jgi:hypothetical protein